MCPPQINWHGTSITDLSCHNQTLYPWMRPLHWCQFYYVTFTHKSFLKYTIRYSNMSSTDHQWHWITIIYPSCCKQILIINPATLKKSLNSHNSETGHILCRLVIYFTPLCQLMAQIQNTLSCRSLPINSTPEIWPKIQYISEC